MKRVFVIVAAMVAVNACGSSEDPNSAPSGTERETVVASSVLDRDGAPDSTTAPQESSAATSGTGTSDSATLSRPTSMSPAWLLPLGSVARPIGVAGNLLIYDADPDEPTSLTGLDPTSGQTIWTYSMTDSLAWFGEVNGSLIVADSDGVLARIDPATGSVLFEVDIGGETVIGTDADSNIVTTSATRLFDNGLATLSAELFLPDQAEPLRDGQRYIQGCEVVEDQLVAIFGDLTTGEVLATLENCVGVEAVFDDGSMLVRSTPTGSEGENLILGDDLAIIQQGSDVPRRFSTSDRCAGANQLVACLSADIVLTASEGWPAETVRLVDECETGGNSNLSLLPRVADERVLCATESDELFMVDTITGEVVSRVPTDIDVGDSFWSAHVIKDMLVVVTSDGEAEGFLLGP